MAPTEIDISEIARQAAAQRRPPPPLTELDRPILLNRANHTGTQLASTISDFEAAVAAVAGSIPFGAGTVTVPNNALWHQQTIAAVGVLPTDAVLLWLAPHLDSDENGPEGLHILSLSGVAGTDEIAVTITFGVKANGPIKLQWSAFR